jgi:SH3 domain
VICEKEYLAQQHDELSLEKSDVVNVFRKQNGWLIRLALEMLVLTFD